VRRRRVGLPDWRHFFTKWRWSGEHGAALLLAFSALATAWSSYQASVWGGVQATQYNLSSVLRGRASAANDEAARGRLFDIALFTKWLEAYAEKRMRLVVLYEKHFRPEFQPAFKAWLADSAGIATTTPFQRADYRLAKATESDSLSAASTHALEAGEHANDLSDDYVFATVILATVLFFAGAVRPLIAENLRGFVLLVATLLCLAALARLLTTPVAR
jgi:divalent metal cation (Fe/Co/Zn/Cd) transporter